MRREALTAWMRRWFISSKHMDAFHASVWIGVVAALLAPFAVLLTTTANCVARIIEWVCFAAALYVIASFFVPLPLIRTWVQRAALRRSDRRGVFTESLLIFREKGDALLSQRERGLFDEATLDEEESDWAWSVVVFLEDALGKEIAFRFQDRVLTADHTLIGVKPKWRADVKSAVRYLDLLIPRGATVNLRPGFDPEKWAGEG